jgi:hypothetical protein
MYIEIISVLSEEKVNSQHCKNEFTTKSNNWELAHHSLVHSLIILCIVFCFLYILHYMG